MGPAFPDDEEILFLFGPARGGTTFLNNLLSRHFDYGMGPEGTFVEKFARRLKSYGDLGDDENLARLIEDVSQCEMLHIARHKYRKQPFDVTPKLIRENLRDRSYAGIVFSVFECVAKVQNRSRIGNKNPGYWRFFDLLQRLFPRQAKYVCIVRDGRDVALSNMKTKWGSSSAYACATTWASLLDAVERMKQTVDPGRLHVLRYEDVLRDPQVSLSRLRDFLVPDLPDQRVARAVGEILEDGRRANFDKWKTKMTERDVRVYEAVAGESLSRCGYARSWPNARVGPLERRWFQFKEYARLVRLNVRAALGGRRRFIR